MSAPTVTVGTPVPAQGNTLVVPRAGLALADGDVIFVDIRSQGTPTLDIGLPAGWFRAGTVGGHVASNRLLGQFYHYVASVASEPATYSFTGVSGGRVIGFPGFLRGADPAHLNDAGQAYQLDATTPATDALATPYTVLAFWGGEFTTGVAVTPTSTPAGYTVQLVAQTAGGDPALILDNSNTTGSRTGGVIVSKLVESGSLTIPALTTAWAGAPTDVRSASWVVRGLSGTPAIGLPVKLGTGAAARLSYLDGAGVRKVPASIRMTLPPFTVTDMLAVPGVTMGHRGASLVPGQPEMSRRGYRYAATQRGYRMLEFSANRTSDGVYIGCHDPSINRTSQTTGLANLSAMTWAEVQAYQNSLNAAGNPVAYYRLDAFLDEFTPEATVHVDPKYNTGGIGPFLDVLDAHGGPTRIVLKYVGVGIGPDPLAVAARARGYLTATYCYEADWSSGALHASQANWDILGMEYTASTDAWARTTVGAFPGIRSYGKPVLAHIIPDQAAYGVAQAKIAEGGWLTGHTWIAQVSGVNVVAPVR